MGYLITVRMDATKAFVNYHVDTDDAADAIATVQAYLRRHGLYRSTITAWCKAGLLDKFHNFTVCI